LKLKCSTCKGVNSAFLSLDVSLKAGKEGEEEGEDGEGGEGKVGEGLD